jgi:hypothetical protein
VLDDAGEQRPGFEIGKVHARPPGSGVIASGANQSSR